jgi:hypothetical protein
MRKLLASLLLFCLLGCGADSDLFPSPVASSQFAGAWVGTWTSSLRAGQGAVRLHFTEVRIQPDGATNVNGFVTLDDSPCVARLRVTGAIEGPSVSATARAAGQQVLLFGELDHSGERMEGRYDVLSGRCAGDSGQWDVRRE